MLTRDGVLLYASQDHDWVIARLIQTLAREYPLEIVERIKLYRVNPESLKPIYKAYESSIDGEWLIHEVECD